MTGCDDELKDKPQIIEKEQLQAGASFSEFAVSIADFGNICNKCKHKRIGIIICKN